MMQQTQ